MDENYVEKNLLLLIFGMNNSIQGNQKLIKKMAFVGFNASFLKWTHRFS